jgi:hypothetical protein
MNAMCETGFHNTPKPGGRRRDGGRGGQERKKKRRQNNAREKKKKRQRERWLPQTHIRLRTPRQHAELLHLELVASLKLAFINRSQVNSRYFLVLCGLSALLLVNPPVRRLALPVAVWKHKTGKQTVGQNKPEEEGGKTIKGKNGPTRTRDSHKTNEGIKGKQARRGKHKKWRGGGGGGRRTREVMERGNASSLTVHAATPGARQHLCPPFPACAACFSRHDGRSQVRSIHEENHLNVGHDSIFWKGKCAPLQRVRKSGLAILGLCI